MVAHRKGEGERRALARLALDRRSGRRAARRTGGRARGPARCPRACARSRRPPGGTPRRSASWSSGAMPMPVSRTEISTPPSVGTARTSTRPPSGVNLTALDSRFSRTCLILRSSRDDLADAAVDLELERRCRAARRARAPASARCRSPGAGRSRASSSSIRPASIFDRSRMSLMSESRWRPEEWMSCRYSSCLSFSSPNMRSSSTSEKPMMAFSGVRSSCDMLARNSDLCWLATSSWPALLLDLAEEARVGDGHLRLVGERLHEAHDALAERPGRAPHHHDAARHVVAAAHGHGQHRAEPFAAGRASGSG